MPNWCMTRAHFRGDTENIFRLNKDIQDSMKYQKERRIYVKNDIALRRRRVSSLY